MKVNWEETFRLAEVFARQTGIRQRVEARRVSVFGVPRWRYFITTR